MSNEAETTIRTLMLKAFDLYNQKNVDEFLACFDPDFSNFHIENGLLSEGPIKAEGLQSVYDQGWTPNLTPRHLNVQVIGEAALVTCYLAGLIQINAATTVQGPWRFTAVLQNTAAGWRIVHNHWSRLLTG